MPNFNVSGVSYQNYRARAATLNSLGEEKSVDTHSFKAFGKLIDLISKHLDNANTREKTPAKTEGESAPEECHGHGRHFRRIRFEHKLITAEPATAQIERSGDEPTPKEEAGLAGDFDADGDVDLDDLNLYRNTEGSTGENLAADGNKDGIVNDLDRKILLDNFGAKKE